MLRPQNELQTTRQFRGRFSTFPATANEAPASCTAIQSLLQAPDGSDYIGIPPSLLILPFLFPSGDGDTGPNTGGMGAYSPAPVVTPQMQDDVMRTIIEPTVRGMAAEGCKFVGVLYAGLMIDPKTGVPKLLEYNVRFGDPECQVRTLKSCGGFHCFVF